MVEAWFDFDEISKLEDLDDDEAEQLCDDSTPDTRPTLARLDAPPPFSSLEGSTLETEHLVSVDDRANGVLYIVQFTVATTPQELYKELAPGGMSCKTELGLGRTLVYLPNGVCMAMEEDPKRSLCPVRREYVIHQTKCGRTLSEARKVDTWEGAVARPLLRFRTVWELKAAPDGKSTRVRCNLSEFEQCQRQELDLAELVIASKDQEILRLLQKFGGADASPPSDYLVFSAPATAELLKAASEGNAKALPRILAKRADPNFTCEPAGYNGELTPLMAAVRARSSPCARLLLQDAGADANIPCRCPSPAERAGDGAFCTALDLAEEVPELASLIREAGGLSMAHLSKAGCCAGTWAGEDAAAGTAAAEEGAFGAAVARLTRELGRIRVLSSGEQRGAIRRLLLQWHPDKNPNQQALATSVFQWLQEAALQAQRRAPGGVHWRTAATPQAQRKAPRAGRRKAPRPPGTVAGKMSVAMKICARQWSFQFLDLLVEQGEDVSQLDDRGRTALFYAVRGIRNPDGGLLHSAGLDPASEGLGREGEAEAKEEDEGDDDDDDDDDDDMITVMVEDHGADVNAVDHSKMTPLMEAARFGNVCACHRLVQLRADVSRENASGHTAIQIAETRVPEYLSSLEAGSDTDGVWLRVQEAINRDRALAAGMMRHGLPRGGMLGGMGRGRLR